MQSSHFALKLLNHLAYNHTVSWLTADRNVIQKLSSFLKRRQLAIQLLVTSRPANSADL